MNTPAFSRPASPITLFDGMYFVEEKLQLWQRYLDSSQEVVYPFERPQDDVLDVSTQSGATTLDPTDPANPHLYWRHKALHREDQINRIEKRQDPCSETGIEYWELKSRWLDGLLKELQSWSDTNFPNCSARDDRDDNRRRWPQWVYDLDKVEVFTVPLEPSTATTPTSRLYDEILRSLTPPKILPPDVHPVFDWKDHAHLFISEEPNNLSTSPRKSPIGRNDSSERAGHTIREREDFWKAPCPSPNKKRRSSELVILLSSHISKLC